MPSSNAADNPGPRGGAPGLPDVVFDPVAALPLLEAIRAPLAIVLDTAQRRIGLASGDLGAARDALAGQGLQSVGVLPPLYPEWLGDRGFLDTHRVRFPYVGGEMALGIATPQMVVALGKAGMLGFLGTAGLAPEAVADGCRRIAGELGPLGISWGANLIHSPDKPGLEERLVDLFLAQGVTRLSASAYMTLRPPVVRYACTGLSRLADGSIGRRHHLFAKVSRAEVARQFMLPPPASMLAQLVSAGALTTVEAELGAQLPLCSDVTVESDSGGHTDFRPMAPLFSVVANLRNRLAREHRFAQPVRLGLAGGLGTPQALAAAFSMGAAYVLVGSVNQSALESGLSTPAKALLGEIGLTDVTAVPAGDMLEVGAKVQVVKKGTLFPAWARLLGELYQRCESIQDIPPKERETLEQKVFRASLDDIWTQTEAYLKRQGETHYQQVMAAPRAQLAALFRWYLGKSSNWARDGLMERRMDFQIWSGPAMGAFNDWVTGSFLEPLENRSVEQIGRNLLEGAAVMLRAQQIRATGFPLPPELCRYRPRPLA
jgi:PfaD family protein